MHGKGIENIRCELCVCCTLYFSFTSLIVRRLQVLATFDYKCAIGPLQLVIRHIIIHVVHCFQLGEQEMHSKKTKKDWHHFKWYLSLFVFSVRVSLFLFSNTDLYHLKRELNQWKTFLSDAHDIIFLPVILPNFVGKFGGVNAATLTNGKELTSGWHVSLQRVNRAAKRHGNCTQVAFVRTHPNLVFQW